MMEAGRKVVKVHEYTDDDGVQHKVTETTYLTNHAIPPQQSPAKTAKACRGHLAALPASLAGPTTAATAATLTATIDHAFAHADELMARDLRTRVIHRFC